MEERVKPVSVEISGKENIAELVEWQLKPTEYDGEEFTDEDKQEKKITFIWPLADVYIYTPEKDPYDPDDQLDDFKGNTITLIFKIPRILLSHPVVKEYGKERLFPIYYDAKKGKWVKFIVTPQEDWENDTVTVKLESWIKDPPVGWGGDYPRSW